MLRSTAVLFTVNNNDNFSTTNESTISAQTLEKCFHEKLDREMDNIVDTVEDRVQSAILAAIDNIITARIDLVVKSINASSGWDAANVSANSECGECIRIAAPFENVSQRNNTFHELNVNDETRRNIPGEVSESLLPRTHFDPGNHTLITICQNEALFRPFTVDD